MLSQLLVGVPAPTAGPLNRCPGWIRGCCHRLGSHPAKVEVPHHVQDDSIYSHIMHCVVLRRSCMTTLPATAQGMTIQHPTLVTVMAAVVMFSNCTVNCLRPKCTSRRLDPVSMQQHCLHEAIALFAIVLLQTCCNKHQRLRTPYLLIKRQ